MENFMKLKIGFQRVWPGFGGGGNFYFLLLYGLEIFFIYNSMLLLNLLNLYLQKLYFEPNMFFDQSMKSLYFFIKSS